MYREAPSGLRHEPTTDTYVLQHDWDGPVELSTTLVHAIECIVGDLPPADGTLYDRIEVDALDRLFAPLASGTRRDVGSLTFEYAGTSVGVTARGEVTITPLRPGTRTHCVEG